MKFLVVILAGLFSLPSPAQQGDVFDQFYRYVEVKNKAIEPHLPGESVDHFTGTLRIVQEDMFLPGKAGLDLRIIRTYSSRIWGRSDLLTNEPLIADKEPTSVGFGWSMHMGRIRNPNASGQLVGTCGGGDFPIYEAPDGTARVFYPESSSMTRFVSRDHWKLEKNCSTQGGLGICITTTSGQTLELAASTQHFSGLVPVWSVSRIADVYGNDITIDYGVRQGTRVVNQITDSWTRTIAFAYANCGLGNCLQSITANGAGGSRAVTYSYTQEAGSGGAGHLALSSPGRAFLESVKPAAGVGYTYDYHLTEPVARNQYALRSITYPYGGWTEYVYDSSSFFTGRESVPMAVVRQRTTSGRELPTGAIWEYEYFSGRSGDDQQTIVKRPDGLQDEYRFYGFGYPANKNATGHVWKVGLQLSVSRANGAEVETTDWEPGPEVSSAPYGAPDYGGSAPCTQWMWDNTVRSPILVSRVMTRDGSRYETKLSDHDPYGQPRTIIETGEAQRPGSKPSRTTIYEYDSDDASNQVVGRISCEKTCEGASTSASCPGSTSSTACFANERTFNSPQRRLNSETLKGVKRTFTYHADGNLKTVENALLQTMKIDGYAAGFGIPTSIDFNGAFTISRTAHWDGSLKSETNGRGDVTSYKYDPAGRLKTIEPPGTNDLSTFVYSPNGDYYSLTRGSGTTAYTETTTLDGLGRVIESKNSLAIPDLQTSEYDALGRLAFKSYPFAAGSAEVGDKFEYDGLGRPTVTLRRYVVTGHRPLLGQCANSPSCKLSINYQPEHCQKTTVERDSGDSTTSTACFESFSDPSEERLVKLTDGKNAVWRYTYDIVGNLKEFTAVGAVGGNRSFTFTSETFFPKTEKSGPRGTTTVETHNAVGQPRIQVDARGIETTTKYDDKLSRPTFVGYVDRLFRPGLTGYGAGSSKSEDVTRTYKKDTLESLSSANGGVYTYLYDELSRVTSVSWVFRGQTYTTGYGFDHTGCLERITYPTGTTLRMTCDRRARTETVKLETLMGSEPIASNVSYHPTGRPKSISYGNGLLVTAALENGRIKSIATPGVLGLTYTYDGASNVKSIVDAVSPADSVSPITYDKLDRLLGAKRGSITTSYDYGPLGDRQRKGQSTCRNDNLRLRPDYQSAFVLEWTERLSQPVTDLELCEQAGDHLRRGVVFL